MTTTTATAATTSNPTTISALSKTSGDLNMFLKLLTTQMQNQDPLEPMESSQYTQQLVEYSQVEQSIKQSGTLQDILAQLSTQNVTQATGFIGKTVEFDHAASGLSDATPAKWRYEASRDVGAMTATIRDASGKTVTTRDIAPKGRNGSLDWDGKLANGTRAKDGAYTLSIAGTDANGNSVPVAITSIGKVGEVNAGNGVVTLGVNGVAIPVAKMVRLSDAGS
ncbi:flagellar hook assembly protein FlgD [Sphingomonas sp.]|jgi:flagellar basal-body rod modification protein FlgD|uniref:flagellar hook assembly protein FlgD n=1 Tax=Sphingomonas sp. TaxID=28214 RepID=UPI002EDAA66C